MRRILNNTAQKMRRICGNTAQTQVLDRVLDGMEGKLTNAKWAAGAWNGRGIHRFPHQWLLISLIYPPKPPADNPDQAGLF
jgi:hypothetical protein